MFAILRYALRSIVCLVLLSACPSMAADAIGRGVITKTAVKSFEEATTQAVTSVKDGESVYLNLKLPAPVETYLARWSYSKNYLNSDKKVLLVDVGPKDEPDTSWENGYILPTAEEMKQTFLSINLAPGAVSPMWIGLWMKVIGNGSPGRWENELRVYALGSTEDTIHSERRLLAVVPLVADVEKGTSKYKALAADYQKRYDAGDPAFNLIPPKGKLVDKAAARGVLAAAKNSMEEKVSGFYFTDNVWYVHKDVLGRVEKHSTYGALFYARDSKKWVRFIEITKWRVGNKIDIALNSELQLTDQNYVKGLALGK